MKQVLIEVPEDTNLLKKSNRATVCLKPLIGPLEWKKLESHTSITLMNDVINSAFRVYSSSLISLTSLFFKFEALPPCLFAHQSNRYRADEEDSLIEKQIVELNTEASNWKEQFESLQLEKDVSASKKETLEKQLRVATAELEVLKAYTNQIEKEKYIMESTFSEQHSRATKEIKSLN